MSKRIFLYLLLCLSFRGYTQNADIDLLRNLNVHRNQNLDLPMEVISVSEAYIGVAAPVSVCVAAFVKKDKKLLEKGVNMSFALVASSARTYVLKRIVNRPRPAYSYPDIQALEPDLYFSFPSGHTSNAFVTATSLSLNFKKWYVVLPSYAWACAAGYSRLHRGVHYPSDVLAGAVVGAGSALITYKANQWLRRFYEVRYMQKNFGVF
ncbi:MAG: phosphatase PAP2 family protein [Chitinophagaceae bacterium]|nr:phosphatase PAP2 family protein [Chitinophagaceae bacterium]